MEFYSPFIRKLKAFVDLSDTDLLALGQLHARRRRFPAGRDMIHQGQRDQKAYLLADGWVCSYKLLKNGNRQILDFKIPGDFLGLRSIMLRTSDHNEEPITAVEASEVTKDELIDAFTRMPRLSAAVLWSASRDESMLVEHLVGIGRRNAAERMAHFLLEMAARLKLVGLSGINGYSCPLSQYLMADALGLSAVHVNRVLRELREAGLVTFQNGQVTFEDFNRLVAFADFDRVYLDQGGPLVN